jgi:hypothetical protein
MSDGILRSGSYIFGYVIKNLIDVGYDLLNLKAAPYDWRLPPGKKILLFIGSQYLDITSQKNWKREINTLLD